MTQKQKDDFLLYGCMSRAIMKVCGQNSVVDFCAKYEKWFRPEYYGMPRGDKIEAILADLGHTPLTDEWDFSKTLAHFRDSKPVIVLSHVAFGDNETNELNHASVLHDADDDSFQLWTAFQNGSDGVFQPFSKQKWIDKKCHGLLGSVDK